MPEVQTPPAPPTPAAAAPAAAAPGPAPAPAAAGAAPGTPPAAPPDTPGAAPAGAKRRIPLYAWMAGLVVVQAGLSFMLLTLRVAPQLARTPPVAAESQPSRPSEPPPATEEGEGQEVGPLEVLEPMVMNLVAPEAGRSSFVKIGVALELDSQVNSETFSERMPIVRDAIIRVVSAKTESDVTDPAGKETLRKEMLAALQNVLGSTTVRNLYYTHFVVQ